MSRTDDLVPALNPPGDGAPPVKFRQGVIASWNADTGSNVVNVGGGQLFDVPILNTAEAITLKVGHVVGLLQWANSWFIVGRITVPGDPDFASASVGFESAGSVASNFAVSTLAPGTIVTAELPVPTWADQALVNISVNTSIRNPLAGPQFCSVWPYIEEFQLNLCRSSHEDGTGAGNNLDWGQASGTWNLFIFDPLQYGDSITVSARAQSTGGTWAADLGNLAYVSAHGIFRSTV